MPTHALTQVNRSARATRRWRLLVERLVRKGLLQRVEDPADRRIRRIHLTDEAERILASLDSAFIPMLELVSAELSLEELEQLLSTIRMVTDAMARANSADAQARPAADTSAT